MVGAFILSLTKYAGKQHLLGTGDTTVNKIGKHPDLQELTFQKGEERFTDKWDSGQGGMRGQEGRNNSFV